MFLMDKILLFFYSMHSLRKRHLRKAITDQYEVNFSFETETLISFYKEMMIKQNIKIDQKKLDTLKNLAKNLIFIPRFVYLNNS